MGITRKKTAKTSKKTAKKAARRGAKVSPRSGTAPPKSGQFQPGNRGGPGRPALTNEEKEIRKFIKSARAANEELLSKLIESGEWDKLWILAIREGASRGKVDGLVRLFESVEGKPPVAITVTGKNPIEVLAVDMERERAKILEEMKSRKEGSKDTPGENPA